jgi:FlaA1/EpsC-like NDP-sugar epimerase
MELDRDTEQRLLGRPVESVLTGLDRRVLKGRRLLVTGAAGSMGGELARQLAACAPASLTLVDHAEHNLARVEHRLRLDYPSLTIHAVLGDVSRRADIRAACDAVRPHTVYHAAAYNRVPRGETSVVAAARTNVLGTVETIRAARAVGARFLLLSSDKAAHPASVMGVTKRLAELVAVHQRSRLFRPVVARFGSILGSRGSEVEIMADAVRAGRKVPVTDPSATRFFLTAEEAASLVIKSDLMGRGGDVFWFEMGQPLRLGELAERVIEWATPAGRPRVEVDVIGLGPGEVLREELTTEGLEMKATSHPRIWQARQHDVTRTSILRAITQIRRACASGDAAAALAALVEVVPQYEPSDAARKAAHLASLRAKGPSSLEPAKAPVLNREVFGRLGVR